MSHVIITSDDKPRLDALRARAKRVGFGIEKARGSHDANNRGGLRIFDIDTNTVTHGADFDVSLNAAEEIVRDLIAREAA